MWLGGISGHSAGGLALWKNHECALSRVNAHPDMTLDVANERTLEILEIFRKLGATQSPTSRLPLQYMLCLESMLLFCLIIYILVNIVIYDFLRNNWNTLTDRPPNKCFKKSVFFVLFFKTQAAPSCLHPFGVDQSCFLFQRHSLWVRWQQMVR